MKTWYVVHGAFTPSPAQFRDEDEAITYAKEQVNDWAPTVTVVKSEVIWDSRDHESKRI